MTTLEINKPRIKYHQPLLATLLTVVIIYLVFFYKTDLTQYRIAQQVWNLGHVLLFMGLSLLACKTLVQSLRLSVYSQFILFSGAALLLGILIEYLQTFTGRDQSGYDVLLDLVGASIGFVLFSETLQSTKRFVRLSFYLMVTLFTLFALIPMLNVVLDDLSQKQSFPFLTENKTTREFSRFKRLNTKLALVNNGQVNSDLKLLRITFMPADNSTVSLEYFNQDWRGYKYLNFRVFNPDLKTTLNIRIHDQRHEQKGYQYRDRFNRQLQLLSGWNDIRISLADIKKAPFKREMNMQKLRSLMFFKVHLHKSSNLFFSPIVLTK